MTKATQLLPSLSSYLATAKKGTDQIPLTRKQELGELAAYVAQQIKEKGQAALVFICTHNSRRSHMSQIWAQVAAAHYGIGGVYTYSGGTEATAFNPRAVAAMGEAGLEISIQEQGENPVYSVRYAQEVPPMQVWSKTYDDPANPQKGFAAIMTCSHADEHCPFIPGAAKRLPIRYDDPKAFDGSPQEHEKYKERSLQIAREMLYAFSLVKQ